jgi:integrase
MPTFIARLKAQPGSVARCLEFDVLCALRSNESISAQWASVDFNTSTMTIPSTAMKTRREFRVALPARAIELLRSLPRLKDSSHIFPGRSGGRLSDRALSQALDRIGYGHVTVHGFRSAFMEFLEKATDFSLELGDQALSHVVGSKVTRAYSRGDGLERRRPLMEAWAGFINPTNQNVDDNVIPLLKALGS